MIDLDEFFYDKEIIKDDKEEVLELNSKAILKLKKI